ncbi:MAG TPA: PLP-dependent aminotransferase family protein [Candidatus Limnocylindria bacterium]|nr:PLP-dependent aminotransferase family protein [Candidatus Limnocylindria bacterium]
MRTSSAIELFVPLARDDARPLHRQLEEQLRDAVRAGRLAASATLPSTRALALQLGVSRGIVVEAYEQLIAEGYLVSRSGGATRIARGATTAPTRKAESAFPRFAVDFRPGRPDLDEFPRAAWLRSLRRVLNEAPSERFSYHDGRGIPELREALAAYLNRVRGTAADPADVVICTGFTQGLKLLLNVLAAGGAHRIAVEDPGYGEARAIARRAGLKIVGIPVDDAGIRVEHIERARVDAVVITPAHQYPTGGVLPPDRRAALAAWAERHDAFVVEDDYDAEFRYDREPIGSLQGLCPDRIVYAGSASKILAPGLRLGWLVVPPPLAEAIARAKRSDDLGSPALEQLAFADFVATGELDRHLRRVRPMYRARRDRLLAALARHLPRLRPVGASAGLHVLAWLGPDIDEAAFIRSAADAGIGLESLEESRLTSGAPGGVIFGYGSVAQSAIDAGARRLATITGAQSRRARSVAARLRRQPFTPPTRMPSMK